MVPTLDRPQPEGGILTCSTATPDQDFRMFSSRKSLCLPHLLTKIMKSQHLSPSKISLKCHPLDYLPHNSSVICAILPPFRKTTVRIGRVSSEITQMEAPPPHAKPDTSLEKIRPFLTFAASQYRGVGVKRTRGQADHCCHLDKLVWDKGSGDSLSLL